MTDASAHSHGSGQACDCHHPAVDLTSVKAMKAFLAEHKVSTMGVAEKSELVDLVKKTLAKLAAESKSTESKGADAKSSDTKESDAKWVVLQVGPLACNCTILWSTSSLEAIVVDPGGDNAKIFDVIKKNKLTVKQILVTHGHFDHFLAADELRAATKAPVLLHKEDLMLWQALPMQLMMIGGAPGGKAPVKMADPDAYLSHNDKLVLFDGVCLHTPGHSAGSCSFYWKQLSLLCSGDTLFKLNIGRTDLPGGNFATIKASITNILYKLPDDTKVIPGHNEHTTIGYEKKNNMVVKASL